MAQFLEIIISQQASFCPTEPQWTDASTSGHLLFRAPGCTVCIARRQAYPATFVYINGDILVCGYGPPELAERILTTPLDAISEDTFCDNEFLYIIINWRQKTVAIQTDAFNTVSVFVGAQKDCFVITSDFGRTFGLLDPRQCSINKRCVAQYLLGHQTYDQTFINEIQLLYDRKRLCWSSTGTSYWLPPDARMKDHYRNRSGNARLFVQLLEQTLARYWQKYIGSGIGGCELSCGLDSSVVAGFFADQGYRLITATALLPGEYSYTQGQKLADFGQRFGIQSVTVPARHYLDYPWTNVLRGETSKPFYHYSAYPYTVFLDDMYKELAQAGVTTVFSGVGGDELFEHVDHRHVMSNTNHASRLLVSMPGFRPLVDYIARSNVQQSDRLPIPIKSHSALTINAGNDRFLNYGLWAVHPLADPRLYAYMQAQSLYYCVDKILLRIYAQARRLPRSIYMPVVNEDFKDVDIEVGRELHEVIIYMLNNSILAESGMLERRPLMEVYQRLREGDVNNEGLLSLLFQNILFAELNLRSLGVRSL